MDTGEDATKLLGQTRFKWPCSFVGIGRIQAFEKADHENGMLGIEVRAARHEWVQRGKRAAVFRRVVAIGFARQTRYYFGSLVLDLLDQPKGAAAEFNCEVMIPPRKAADLNPVIAARFGEPAIA